MKTFLLVIILTNTGTTSQKFEMPDMLVCKLAALSVYQDVTEQFRLRNWASGVTTTCIKGE